MPLFRAQRQKKGTGTVRMNSTRVGPGYPQLVVLFGATGDLSRRKLLPGLFHLIKAGFIPGCRIVGVSLDEIDADGFRAIARESLNQFLTRKFTEAEWEDFSASLDYVSLSAGAGVLKEAVKRAEEALGRRRGACTISLCRRRRRFQPCNSLPRPNWSSVAGLSWRSHLGRTLPALWN